MDKNKSIDKIIWKDFMILESIIKFIFLLWLLFFIYILFKINPFKAFNKDVFAVIIGCTGMAGVIYFISKRKPVYINNKGIRLSNLEYKKSKSWGNRAGQILVKREKSFYKWNDIKKIEFFSKASIGRVSAMWDYLLIETRNGEKVHCLIYNPLGFIKAIKELGRFNLLNKESKYVRPNLYITKKK